MRNIRIRSVNLKFKWLKLFIKYANESWYSWICIKKKCFSSLSECRNITVSMKKTSRLTTASHYIDKHNPKRMFYEIYCTYATRSCVLWDVLYLCHTFVCFMGCVVLMPHVRVFYGILYLYHTFVCIMGYIVLMSHVRMFYGIYCTYITRSYVLWDKLYSCHTFVCLWDVLYLCPTFVCL